MCQLISRMSDLRILVAEDNVINQWVVTKMLEKLSHTAHVVSDGRKAVDAARETRYDIIFMDVMMPVMGGKEASEIIRSEEPPEHRAHIIALTANALDADRSKCLEAGMDDYISKPFVLETLRQKLHHASEHISNSQNGTATH